MFKKQIQKIQQKTRELIFSLLKSWFPIIPSYEAGVEKAQPFSYYNASEEGYKQGIWVYRCIKEIANRVSSVKWYVAKKNTEGSIEELPNHPLNNLIQNLNPHFSFNDFLEQFVTYLYISGNAYLDISEKQGGRVSQIFFLRSDRIKIVPDPKELVKEYHFVVDGATTVIPKEDIFHFKFIDPTNDFYGLSPVYVAGKIIDTENIFVSWNKNMFRNSARPGGVLESKDLLNDSQFDRLKAQVQTWQGSDNAGKPIILEGGLTWKTMSMTPLEADFKETKRLNREEICGVFGVPPVIVGILDHATYSNYREAELIMWNQTVIPVLEKFVGGFNKSVSATYGDGVFLAYDLGNVQAMRQNEESLMKRAKDGWTAGILTKNESRELLGYEAVPDGDVYAMPGTLSIMGQGGMVAPPGGVNPEGDNPPTEEGKASDINSVRVVDTSANASRLYFSTLEKKRKELEEVHSKKVIKILNSVYKEISKEIKKAERNEVDAILTSAGIAHKDKIQKFYESLYTEGIKTFGEWGLENLKQSLPGAKSRIWTMRQKDSYEILQLPLSFESLVFNPGDPIVDAWVREINGERAIKVSENTIKTIKDIVNNGFLNGDTMREIADKIMAYDESFSVLRADMIAATEIVNISNAGSYFSAVQTGLSGLKKVWLATSDDRTRETHREANGQKQNLTDPFKLPGGELMFPGDPTRGASTDELVRCRCTLVYDTTGAGGLVEGIYQ